jgi:uncharacterized protein
VNVTSLSVTAVKATRLQSVDRIELTAAGARGNRRFFMIDERDRLVNGKHFGELQSVVADCTGDVLRLTLPDGTAVQAPVQPGEPVSARFTSRTETGRIVPGPWSQALSELVHQPLRLVESDGAVDRGRRGAVSLISRASLARLAVLAGESVIDGRRFRMLVEIDGAAAHAEDDWVGRTVRLGVTAVRFHGHVGRCLITSRDPDTGRIDLPTLDVLGSYRQNLDTTEPLPFGIYGEVLQEGAVRVGDRVLVEA